MISAGRNLNLMI